MKRKNPAEALEIRANRTREAITGCEGCRKSLEGRRRGWGEG